MDAENYKKFKVGKELEISLCVCEDEAYLKIDGEAVFIIYDNGEVGVNRVALARLGLFLGE